MSRSMELCFHTVPGRFTYAYGTSEARFSLGQAAWLSNIAEDYAIKGIS